MNSNRPTLINGQLVPKIYMKPGEVQRWRFIHAGISENVAVALDFHPLHEVATDGISLGRSVAWPDAAAADSGPVEYKLVLAPGYRTDGSSRRFSLRPASGFFCGI